MNAGFERFAEYGRDGDGIVRCEKDAIDATRNGIIDELDLFLDIPNCRTVRGYFGWKTGFGQIRASFCDSLCSGIKVADTDELRYIGQDDLLPLQIFWVYGL